ncbi:MAG: PHP domain-containing protein [Abditibacteriota bacterium]|nr:PHP domain-containing protein [Abditibacteriota bacterium]
MNPSIHDSLEDPEALRAAVAATEFPPASPVYVNNHIHTVYSFSPYTPAKAVLLSKQAGLSTCGIMDHDSVAGTRQFIEAGRIVGIRTTIGFEVRASFAGTPLEGKRINNPDQPTMAYMALHGIPHTQIDACDRYLAPYRKLRLERDRLMTARLSEVAEGAELDFDRDVLPISRYEEGGTVTERHLLFAFAGKIMAAHPLGRDLTDYVEQGLGIALSPTQRQRLGDPVNPHGQYDLLGVFKSSLMDRFFIPAGEECPPVRELIDFARSIGAISAYAYLGDVGESVTGDKKAQTFEDSYLELLFDTLSDLGFDAVTYMPSRNTPEQLRRVKALCDLRGLMQISGEDINSSRQSFVCKALENPEFANLITATWALIGHEEAATRDLSLAITAPGTRERLPDLEDRIAHYAALAKNES